MKKVMNDPVKVTSLAFNDVIYPIIRPSCEPSSWIGDKRFFKKDGKVIAIELGFFAYVEKEIMDKIIEGEL